MGLQQFFAGSHAGTGANTAVATVPAGRRWVVQRVHGLFFFAGGGLFAVSILPSAGGLAVIGYNPAQPHDSFYEALRKDVALAGDGIGLNVPVGGFFFGIISGLDLLA